MREEDILHRFERIEMRWLSNATLRDRISSAERRGGLGIEDICGVLCTGMLRWFGHVDEEMHEYDCGGQST